MHYLRSSSMIAIVSSSKTIPFLVIGFSLPTVIPRYIGEIRERSRLRAAIQKLHRHNAPTESAYEAARCLQHLAAP